MVLTFAYSLTEHNFGIKFRAFLDPCARNCVLRFEFYLFTGAHKCLVKRGYS